MGKETVAVIHYMDGAWEREVKTYSLNSMSQMIEFCEKKGFVYYVCLTKLDTIIPVSSHKPVTVFKSSTEYIDKVDNTNSRHRAFRDVTRIEQKQARHPPTVKERNKAYGQH